MIISLARERSIATIGGNAYILAAQSEANLRLVTAASLRNLLEIQTLETNSRPALHPDLVIRNLHFYQDPLAIWTSPGPLSRQVELPGLFIQLCHSNNIIFCVWQ